MTDYLHPGKVTTGQYCAEPIFTLLDVTKQKHWRKLESYHLGVLLSWQCTSAQVVGCWASSPRLNLFNWAILPIVQTAPSDCFLIRNLKYHLHGAWFVDDESLMIAVEAWESKQENLFSGHKQLRRKVEKMHWCCRRICWKMTACSQVAKLLDRPSYFTCMPSLCVTYFAVC